MCTGYFGGVSAQHLDDHCCFFLYVVTSSAHCTRNALCDKYACGLCWDGISLYLISAFVICALSFDCDIALEWSALIPVRSVWPSLLWSMSCQIFLGVKKKNSALQTKKCWNSRIFCIFHSMSQLSCFSSCSFPYFGFCRVFFKFIIPSKIYKANLVEVK